MKPHRNRSNVSEWKVINNDQKVVDMLTQLNPKSLDWALAQHESQGDTDLLPIPFELDIIRSAWNEIRTYLARVDIENYPWTAFRNMLVPKDELLFRNSTQLNPLDSLIFAAITKEIASRIENTRMSRDEETVFSYRYDASSQGFYGDNSGWMAFWESSRKKALNAGVVLVTDITDYYNQIYHHTLENQLNKASSPRSHTTALLNLLKRTTQEVSRGIPVGPHASHLLAESAVCPVDEFLSLKGYRFCRYVDDIHIFCDTAESAHVAVYDLANALNQSKLTLNRHKTCIMSGQDFVRRATQMLEEDPVNDEEKAVIELLRKKTTGNPYQNICFVDLSSEELKSLTPSRLRLVLSGYLDAARPNFTRLRWLLRRLSQVGTPAVIDYVIDNLSRLSPAIADATLYLKSASANYDGNWKEMGTFLIAALDHPFVVRNEYLELVILTLFGAITDLDHIGIITDRFDRSRPAARREIVLAAARTNAESWIRSLKESFSESGPWLKSALLYGMRVLPEDERRMWLRRRRREVGVLDNAIIKAIT